MFAFLLLFLPAASALAARWETLENCRLVGGEYMDGDSFHVKHGTKQSIFRLYFVDSPETDDSFPGRIADQAAYWNISAKDIPKLGRRAKSYTTRALGPGFTVYTQWQDAGGQSSMPRYFAVVRIGKKDLAELLVSEGLARVYGASVDLPYGGSGDSFFSRLRSLEARARGKHRGAWSDVAALPPETEATNAPPPPPAWVADRSTNTWNNVPTVAFLRAEAYVNTERFEEAEPELRALLERYPDHAQKARIEFYLALAVTMQEKFEEGIALFEQWMKDHPSDGLQAEVEYWLPIALYYNGDTARAQLLFNDFAAKYPLSVYTPEATYRAALCRYAGEDYKNAALDLGAWIQKYPDHYFRWEAQVIRGDALAAMGMLDEAKENYSRVTADAGPFYYLALTQLAKVHKALATEQDFRAMADEFITFIKEQPDSGNVVDAAYQAGWALRQIDRIDEARKLYWSTIAQYGNNRAWEGFEPLLKDLSALYGAPGTGTFDDDFRQRYDVALKEGKRTLASRLTLAKVPAAATTAQKFEMSRTMERLFTPDAMGPEVLAFIGESRVAAGTLADGQSWFERILKDFPESRFAGVAQTRLAERMLELGDWEKAFEHAARAVDTAGDAEMLMLATYARAESLRHLARAGEAIADYNAVLAGRATPRALKPEAMLGLAACMEAEGKEQQAIPYYQRIYVMYQAYTGPVAKAYLRSGEIFEKLNDRQAAINTYREMLGLENMAATPEAASARERLAKLEG